MNVCCACVRNGNSILLVKNKDRAWELPGGKSESSDFIEFGSEKLLNVMEVGKRELFEETGMNTSGIGVRLDGILFNIERNTLFLRFNVLLPTYSKPIQDASIVDFKWMSCQEIEFLELSFESDRAFILKALLKEPILRQNGPVRNPVEGRITSGGQRFGELEKVSLRGCLECGATLPSGAGFSLSSPVASRDGNNFCSKKCWMEYCGVKLDDPRRLESPSLPLQFPSFYAPPSSSPFGALNSSSDFGDTSSSFGDEHILHQDFKNPLPNAQPSFQPPPCNRK